MSALGFAGVGGNGGGKTQTTVLKQIANFLIIKLSVFLISLLFHIIKKNVHTSWVVFQRLSDNLHLVVLDLFKTLFQWCSQHEALAQLLFNLFIHPTATYCMTNM